MRGTGSMGGMEWSPARRKRARYARKAEEASWAARSGPVVVTRPAASTSPAEGACARTGPQSDSTPQLQLQEVHD